MAGRRQPWTVAGMWLRARSDRGGPYFPYPSAEAEAAAFAALRHRLAVSEGDLLALCHRGLGDPTITPCGEALAELQARLRALTAAPPLDPSGRRMRNAGGYAGVELRDPLAPTARVGWDEPRERWRIFAGWVTCHRDGEYTCWADPGAAFEEWLIGLLGPASGQMPDAAARARARGMAVTLAGVAPQHRRRRRR